MNITITDNKCTNLIKAMKIGDIGVTSNGSLVIKTGVNFTYLFNLRDADDSTGYDNHDRPIYNVVQILPKGSKITITI